MEFEGGVKDEEGEHDQDEEDEHGDVHQPGHSDLVLLTNTPGCISEETMCRFGIRH